MLSVKATNMQQNHSKFLLPLKSAVTKAEVDTNVDFGTKALQQEEYRAFMEETSGFGFDRTNLFERRTERSPWASDDEGINMNGDDCNSDIFESLYDNILSDTSNDPAGALTLDAYVEANNEDMDTDGNESVGCLSIDSEHCDPVEIFSEKQSPNIRSDKSSRNRMVSRSRSRSRSADRIQRIPSQYRRERSCARSYRQKSARALASELLCRSSSEDMDTDRDEERLKPSCSPWSPDEENSCSASVIDPKTIITPLPDGSYKQTHAHKSRCYDIQSGAFVPGNTGKAGKCSQPGETQEHTLEFLLGDEMSQDTVFNVKKRKRLEVIRNKAFSSDVKEVVVIALYPGHPKKTQLFVSPIVPQQTSDGLTYWKWGSGVWLSQKYIRKASKSKKFKVIPNGPFSEFNVEKAQRKITIWSFKPEGLQYVIAQDRMKFHFNVKKRANLEFFPGFSLDSLLKCHDSSLVLAMDVSSKIKNLKFVIFQPVRTMNSEWGIKGNFDGIDLMILDLKCFNGCYPNTNIPFHGMCLVLKTPFTTSTGEVIPACSIVTGMQFHSPDVNTRIRAISMGSGRDSESTQIKAKHAAFIEPISQFQQSAVVSPKQAKAEIEEEAKWDHLTLRFRSFSPKAKCGLRHRQGSILEMLRQLKEVTN